jgi:putative NADH-flavin reductase
MKQNMKIAIIGGGGRTGKYLVTQLINQGYSVKLLIRNPENFQIKSSLIEIVKGDALDFETINYLLKNCQAVISTVGQRPGEPLVAELATKNVLQAMLHNKVKRYLLVAGVNIDTPFDNKSEETIIATNWMKTNYPEIQEDRQKAYTLLFNSSVDWTLVRVPFIEFTDAVGKIVVNLEDCLGNKISAGNIAAFLIEQLSDKTYIGKSPFIANS